MFKFFPYLFILFSVTGNAQIVLQKDDQMQQSLPDQGIHEMAKKNVE